MTFTVTSNVAYGIDPALDCDAANLVIPNSAPCLDVYLPDTIRPGAPTVLWIHGGSFVTKDKADQRDADLCRALASRGVPAVSINYTLADCASAQKAFPESILDVKLAMAWIRGNVGLADCLPDCVLAAGASAGAIHAALLGTAWDVPELDPLFLPPAAQTVYRPNAVVGFSVHADFQLLGCAGGGVDPSCANGNTQGCLGSCGGGSPEGCCLPGTAFQPGYVGGHNDNVLCYLGVPWLGDCATFPDAVTTTDPLSPNQNVWAGTPPNPFLNASPRHWAGFSDAGSMLAGLNDPPLLVVQPRCDLLGQPDQGRLLRDSLLAAGGVAAMLELDAPCDACAHGLQAFTSDAAADLILDVWENPASWFGSVPPPPGGYLNCP